MTFSSRCKAGLAAGALGALCIMPALDAALAQAAAATAPVPNKGDTAWLLISSALVLMMSVPGLALFYGGLVRSKNMLSILTQVLAIVSMMGLLWCFFGYSIALGDGGGHYLGGFGKAFLKGIDANSTVATFSNGVVVPEFAYLVFQMTFAMITPALIVGAFAERVKFSAVMLFTFLWATFIYFPVAHWVWATPAPDDLANAARALAAAGGDAAGKAAAQAKIDELFASAGWINQGRGIGEFLMNGVGALDFAGGTVVHINAGIAGLVGAIMVGKRVGYPREAMMPHSLTMTMIGTSLLWVGWFGFNAGSNLEANGTTALAFLNTMVATCAGAFSWLMVEWIAKGKPSLLGMASGAVAGLVAITPASGFAGPMGAIVLGLLVSPVCFIFVSKVKHALGYDDALDVFGVHCVGGVIGAIATGALVNPALGGVGVADYLNIAGNNAGVYAFGQQMVSQIVAVIATLVWSGAGSAVLYKIVDLTVGLRLPGDNEREGLDVVDHGERAYNY
ncbi:MAG: ammonium transporter [Rhodoblastus sp.]